MRLAFVVAAAAAVALTAAPARAADGVVMVTKITSNGKVATHQTQMDKTHLRSDTDQNGRKVTVIYDAAGGVLRTIDDQNKTYTELTKADLDRIATQVSGAMAQMQQQLANLPPEQRARVEAMMQVGRGTFAQIAGPPPVYKKVGTDTVGAWRCDKYEGTKNGDKASEVCTVQPAALGLLPGDFDAAKQMAELFSKMVPSGLEGMFHVGSGEANAFSGIPVRTVTFRNGAPSSTIEVTGVNRENIPESVFAVPSGYQKREMQGMGRGRGQQ